MDAGSEAADLMVREGLQITEATVKLLAAGSKNLAAFLYALAKDNKRVSGKTNMGRLLREGKELRVFQLRESDMAAFNAYAKKGILYAVVKDKNAGDGLVDLITNVDFASQVNLFLERHGYAAPQQEDDAAKKADARAPQGSFSPQRCCLLQTMSFSVMTVTAPTARPCIWKRLLFRPALPKCCP